MSHATQTTLSCVFVLLRSRALKMERWKTKRGGKESNPKNVSVLERLQKMIHLLPHLARKNTKGAKVRHVRPSSSTPMAKKNVRWLLFPGDGWSVTSLITVRTMCQCYRACLASTLLRWTVAFERSLFPSFPYTPKHQRTFSIIKYAGPSSIRKMKVLVCESQKFA
jgi:hypothetical protein